MKEKEFLQLLAEKWDCTQKEACKCLEEYHELLKSTMKSEGEVIINAMGKYEVVSKPEREARNPLTGEQVKVPAKKVAKWKPNKKFKDDL